MTLREIAEKAGVSISTVSRVLNSPDGGFARPEVRRRVWDAVRETGYVPNQTARALRRRHGAETEPPRSLTCILGRTRRPEDNPFFGQVARAAEQQALQLGYAVSLAYSVADAADGGPADRAAAAKTDGAIVLGRFSEDAMRLLERRYRSIVYVGRNVADWPCDQVLCDGYAATQTALRYLADCGHRRIAYLGETRHEVRFRAFRDAVQQLHLDADPRLVCACAQNGAGGYEGAGRLLEQPLPSAVFCAADVAAIAAMRRFAEAGLRVPEQLSVIGMDNIELAQYVSPMLTTVEMPMVEMGRVAVQTLFGRMRGQHRLPMKIYLPSRLMIRESVRPAAKKI